MADWPPPPERNRPPARMILSEDIASKALDAYKSNPLLTAIFLLNVTTFLGFGAYLWDKENKVAKFIYQVQADMKDLRLEAIRATSDCWRNTSNRPQYILPPAEIPAPPRRPK